jgi:glutamate dehydrogenase/leucine dehydrogenase
MYRKLALENTGVLTGKGMTFGGSLIRPEATGYGAVYFLCRMLSELGESIEGKRIAISGFGNVAWGAAKKATELGAKVVGYKNEEELKALIGEEATVEQIKHPILGESVRRVVSEDKVYLLIECSGTIVYEIIDKGLSCEELLAQIVKTGAVSLKNKWLQENYNYLPSI